MEDLVELNKLLRAVSEDMTNLNARTRHAYVRHLKGLMIPLMEDAGRWTPKTIRQFEEHDHTKTYLNILKDSRGPKA